MTDATSRRGQERGIPRAGRIDVPAVDDAEKPIGQTRWRRGWDLNPRLSFPNTRFPSVLLKPLGHLSVGVGEA
jgi:hypothetical protein